MRAMCMTVMVGAVVMFSMCSAVGMLVSLFRETSLICVRVAFMRNREPHFEFMGFRDFGI